MTASTQEFTNDNDTLKQFIKAAEHIRKRHTEIKNNWEDKVRTQIDISNIHSSKSLLNSMEIFLEDAANFIEQGYYIYNPSKEAGMSKEHGKFRATFSGYFLPQLLKEFSLLREVLNSSLQKENLLTYNVRFIIDKILDDSISQAATEFALVQKNAVEDALSRAQQSNQALEHFAAIAAHDLKSPLATITSYLDLLKDESDKKNIPYIELCLGASARMRSLIDSLLTFAKLSTKQKELAPVDLNEVLDLSKKNLADEIAKSSVSIEATHLPIVLGDKDLLTQLFQNLIANAIKFKSNNPPRIQISFEERDHHFILALKDNGIGFDPKYKEDIFTLYKKLSGKYSGSGIGLATCRKILELHGGKIWVESAIDQGSTFFFSLQKANVH